MLIKIRKIRPNDPFFVPIRFHVDDAGLDLFASANVRISPGQFVDVPTNVAVELPKRTWARVVGRSSTFCKLQLIVHTATIDSGYRGELFIPVLNPGPGDKVVRVGDRIAQLIVLPLLTPLVKVVGELSSGTRGSDGFGSTNGIPVAHYDLTSKGG